MIRLITAITLPVNVVGSWESIDNFRLVLIHITQTTLVPDWGRKRRNSHKYPAYITKTAIAPFTCNIGDVTSLCMCIILYEYVMSFDGRHCGANLVPCRTCLRIKNISVWNQLVNFDKLENDSFIAVRNQLFLSAECEYIYLCGVCSKLYNLPEYPWK